MHKRGSIALAVLLVLAFCVHRMCCARKPQAAGPADAAMSTTMPAEEAAPQGGGTLGS